jgi:D-glycero-D-manno-heptose 1,7-bisphosphate phosphatase
MGVGQVSFAERTPEPKRAVFLDRDGVLNRARVENGRPYAARTLEEVELVDGAQEACRQLKAAGLWLVMVTNQPEIARGTLSRELADRINGLVASRLGLDEVLMCPHDDADQCACRKPKPGMLLDAAERRGIDLGHSVMVGDRWRDIEAGRRAGCQTAWIDRGYAEQRPTAELRAKSLADAVPWILQTTLGKTP